MPDNGASGQIYKAEIETGYHPFEKNIETIKRLTPQYDDPARDPAAFMNELGILKALWQEHHLNQHLIDLLTSSEWHEHHFLIFPWADGDLEDFWGDTVPEEGMSKFVLDQRVGLAEALRQIMLQYHLMVDHAT